MQITDWAHCPWDHVPEADLAPALQVPSMLTLAEARLYHWLGRQAEGCGAVVDLGAFAGGSAARLLSGLMLGPSTARLYAYDRFTADPRVRAAFLYPAGVAKTDDPDILPLVQRHLARWQDRVSLIRGEIADQEWHRAPVEILAVDAAKSTKLNDHIAAQFYRHLVPGRSVLIHQDFLQITQPWLAVQMLALTRFFTPVAFTGPDCVVFECRKKLNPGAVQRAATLAMTDEDLITGLHAAASEFAPFVPPERILAMIPKLRANPGVRIAWQMKN